MCLVCTCGIRSTVLWHMYLLPEQSQVGRVPSHHTPLLPNNLRLVDTRTPASTAVLRTSLRSSSLRFCRTLHCSIWHSCCMCHSTLHLLCRVCSMSLLQMHTRVPPSSRQMARGCRCTEWMCLVRTSGGLSTVLWHTCLLPAQSQVGRVPSHHTPPLPNNLRLVDIRSPASTAVLHTPLRWSSYSHSAARHVPGPLCTCTPPQTGTPVLPHNR